MEIMLSHLGVGVAYDALDGLDIHAQCLHLRHIGVAAAVRRRKLGAVRTLRPASFKHKNNTLKLYSKQLKTNFGDSHNHIRFYL